MASVDAKLLVVLDELNKVKKTVAGIQTATETVSKQVGPKGDKGERGETGPQGPAGKGGVNGKDGKDGVDGIDGQNGKDGVSVVDAEIDIDNSLVLKLSDGNIIDAGQIYIKAPEAQTVYNTGYRSITQATPVYAVRYDEVSSSTAYRGEATAGATEGEPAWRIQKIVIVNDDVTITWASGTTEFDKVWTNRLSYTYL